MSRWVQSLVVAGFALVIAGVPLLYHRYHLTTHKRFREVTQGRLYRSGQMTADGFAAMIRRYGIRTVIDVQNEYDDPDLRASFFNPLQVKESEICRALGVRFINLDPDLVSRKARDPRPHVIDAFLDVMDDPSSFPVLIHCKAGLHRTGVLVAVYRMEYDGWSPAAAIEEMKQHGFGDSACTSANDYVRQYVLQYRPRRFRREAPQ